MKNKRTKKQEVRNKKIKIENIKWKLQMRNEARKMFIEKAIRIAQR